MTDDATLAQLAVDRGALTKLADLVKFITPTEPSASGEWEDEEPESISCLREVFSLISRIRPNRDANTVLAGRPAHLSRPLPI